jgi:hypothetical protein
LSRVLNSTTITLRPPQSFDQFLPARDARYRMQTDTPLFGPGQHDDRFSLFIVWDTTGSGQTVVGTINCQTDIAVNKILEELPKIKERVLMQYNTVQQALDEETAALRADEKRLDLVLRTSESDTDFVPTYGIDYIQFDFDGMLQTCMWELRDERSKRHARRSQIVDLELPHLPTFSFELVSAAIKKENAEFLSELEKQLQRA